MAFGVEPWFFLAFLVVVIVNLQLEHVFGQPKVPCYFIFGDSLVDNGNNNLISTHAQANYRPYGIDFGDGNPTGRFTNGPNMADFIAELLGFETPIAPFARAVEPNITRGVNYGSGAAGIRYDTAEHLGGRVSLDGQLLHHRKIIAIISHLLRGKNISVKKYLSKCLYTVAIGSNDYINNYLLPEFYRTGRIYTPQQFADVLYKQYFRQLRWLYRLGARKIAIFGLGNLGCIPQELSKYQTDISGCVDFINDNVRLFDIKLKTMVDKLNVKFPHAKYIFVNATSIANTTAMTLVSKGVRIFNAPCCEVSTTFAEGQCALGGNICSNRSEYAFFDNFHPTSIVIKEMTKVAYNSDSSLDVYPFNISTLVAFKRKYISTLVEL